MWNEKLKIIDKEKTPLLAANLWGKVDNLQLVNEGINLVYCYIQGTEKYYLRLTHAKLRSHEELQAALAYQMHLFENDAPVCEPIKSTNNLWFESIWQGEDEFLAHVCKEVPGEPIRFDYSDFNIYKNWGHALGKLHRAAGSYKLGIHNYAIWSASLDELDDYVKNETIEVKHTLQKVSQYLKSRPQTSINYGLTHGDHREGNVLTDGKQVNIIDFDLPSLNWYTEDLFRPFFDSIVSDKKNWQDKINPYLEGYFKIMPEAAIDLNAFPWQIQMKCLEIYLWTKHNWSDKTAPGGNDKKLWLLDIYQKIVRIDWSDRLKIVCHG